MFGDLVTNIVGIFRMDSARMQSWDSSYLPSRQFMHANNYMKPMRNLAALQQKRLDILAQLEIIAKQAVNNSTKMNGNNGILERQENMHNWDDNEVLHFTPVESCKLVHKILRLQKLFFIYFKQIAGAVFVRSDSILTDDDYVPFEPTTPTPKYGPISRMSNQPNSSNNGNGQMTNDGKRINSSWIFNQVNMKFN